MKMIVSRQNLLKINIRIACDKPETIDEYHIGDNKILKERFTRPDSEIKKEIRALAEP